MCCKSCVLTNADLEVLFALTVSACVLRRLPGLDVGRLTNDA
jgi:hypothetical protein